MAMKPTQRLSEAARVLSPLSTNRLELYELDQNAGIRTGAFSRPASKRCETVGEAIEAAANARQRGVRGDLLITCRCHEGRKGWQVFERRRHNRRRTCYPCGSRMGTQPCGTGITYIL